MFPEYKLHDFLSVKLVFHFARALAPGDDNGFDSGMVSCRSNLHLAFAIVGLETQ